MMDAGDASRANEKGLLMTVERTEDRAGGWAAVSMTAMAAAALLAAGGLAGCGRDDARTPAASVAAAEERAGGERTGEVTRAGQPLTLVGPRLKVGDRAPDAVLTANDMKEVRLASYFGRVLLVSAVPSLDTKVCDLETRRFNEMAAGIPNVTILTISMDLPFAQARWCGAHDVKNVTTLSDFRAQAFGRTYGVLIKEMGLEARTIFVIGRDGRIAYVQRVADITHEPDYDAALAAAKAAK
jgi:thioredoxin-dependent peroxiredoxin